VVVGTILAAVAGAWGVSAVQSKSASSSASGTLVVDRSFEIKTADPQRAFEPTAAIVDRGIYDTFFTYKGGDLAHPVPMLVQSWKASKDAKTFVFNLRRNVHFADGTPLTSADAVFSFRRLINLKGNPSFLLDGARPVHRRSPVDHTGYGTAVDPDQHIARDRQLQARAQARRHLSGRRRQVRQGREVVELCGVARCG
jgi:peptide/nickel transport system substrate-binding protein